MVNDSSRRTDRGLKEDTLERMTRVERRLSRLGRVDRGSAADRDYLYPPPTDNASRAALANRQVRWFNTDTGFEESYYAPTGTPGLTVKPLISSAPADWYPTGPGPTISLAVWAPQSMTSGLTFTNWTLPGVGSSFCRGGAAYFGAAAGAITLKKAGRYEASCSLAVQTGAGQGAAYLIRNNSTVSPNVTSIQVYTLSSAYGVLEEMGFKDLMLNANDNLRWYAAAIGSAIFGFGGDGVQRAAGEFVVRYLGPPLASDTV